MLENSKQQAQDEGNDEFNLLDDGQGKGVDIIVHGEKIADTLGQIKVINPNILASQLQKLTLAFNDEIIVKLNEVSVCTAIEGVEVSQEELDAFKDAVNAKAEAQDGADDFSGGFAQDMMKMGSGSGIGNISGFGAPQIESRASIKVMNDPQPIVQTTGDSSYVNSFTQPQNTPQVMQSPVVVNDAMPMEEELDAEFISEIETYLQECLQNNEVLIDMSDTLIRDQGAKMVAAAASLCDQLQELRVKDTGITDEGAIEVFTELTALKQLQVIDISQNAITERSLDSLTHLLNCNQNLVVNMRMNGIKNKFAAKKMQHYEQQGRLNIQNV